MARTHRTLALALLLAVVPIAASADPAQEARSATAACLSAVIDKAPVEDIDGDDVTIRRGTEPVSCTVQVTAGQPVVTQDAVQAAIKRRAELFVPAKTKWDAGDWAFRETFCNVPGRRALMVFVSTNKPDRQPVLTATVFEADRRDERCDRDLGVQSVAANDPPAATTAVRPPPDVADPPKKAKRKQSWLRRIPGLARPE